MIKEEKLKVHSGVIRSIDFSPDGFKLVSGSDDKKMNMWDFSKGKRRPPAIFLSCLC